MPPHYFERSAGSSVVGSPLTPRRINEVRAETGGLGKGEMLLRFKNESQGLSGVQQGRCFSVHVQLIANTFVTGISIAIHIVKAESLFQCEQNTVVTVFSGGYVCEQHICMYTCALVK